MVIERIYDCQSSDHLVVGKARDCIEFYSAFARRVDELKLSSSVDARPIIDVSAFSRFLSRFGAD